PIGAEDEFRGIVDLIEEKALIYLDDLGTQSETQEVPAELAATVEKYRNQLLESLAEFDEEILEDYLEGKEIAPERIRTVLRKVTIESKLTPVLCGSAFKNKGV